ncbi:MAG TPA: efflux RND transporter permease subunit, partial [Vicinamibacterales bacterium]|nr:efflux RND transporter permease subunit [Vicinamibacterales bacterium]
GRDVGGFVEEARERIDAEVALPPGYFVTFGGQFEGQQRAMRHLAVLMAIVLLVIFVILFSSFGSIWQAALVLLCVPTTLAGAMIALLVTGDSLNVSSTIGLIALFGVCAQNDIVLIGKINDLRRLGTPLREAVVQGSLLKLRPLLMTDLVMIVSVLPLVLSQSTGSELHRPLAVVYVGGFLFALFLRRFFVPVLYEGMARLFERPSPAEVVEQA